LVGHTAAMFPKCIKITESGRFNELELQNAKALVKQKKLNVIEYDCVNEVEVGGKKYTTLILEYANAGVLL
jgi:hypothetical protein